MAAIAVSGISALLLVGDAPGMATAGSSAVEVSFDEWTLETDVDRVEAGPVSLLVENQGAVDHEMLVVRTELDPGELPQGIAGPVPRLAGKLVLGSEHAHEAATTLTAEGDPTGSDHIAPGEEVSYDVDLKPGSYALFCNLSGHYRRGQFSGLTVE